MVYFIYFIGIGVVFNERERDYAFMMQSLSAAAFEITGKKMSPQHIMCDAAPAIGNAFLNSFDNPQKVLMCWAHASARIYKAKYDTQDNKDQIKVDILLLQKSPSAEIFLKGIELFNEKWETKEPVFIKHFNGEWVEKNKNWFGGSNLTTPNTNNCLESFNNTMKNHQTMRRRITIAEFKQFVLEIVAQRSLEYKDKHKVYVEKAPIADKTWILGYRLSKGDKQILKKNFGNYTKYYLKAGENNEIADDDIIFAQNLNWKSFDEFKEKAFSVWEVVLYEHLNWQDGTCTCPVYQLDFVCKHLVATAIRTKVVKPPDFVKARPLEKKRKRGRPPLARDALKKN